ncbi:MAG TPA: cyclase family protein [Steroidobacteraceae bacterium]|nr:cyclase family protein [Steroidobacteraceae bacterium]
MQARVAVDGREFAVDLARPIDLALELDFAGPQPRHFSAPRASSRPFETPGFGFKGSVARGSSCNCDVITLIPHCNGTHTEAAGHLTRERLDAWRVTPTGLLPALLVSVTPEAPNDEGSEPQPRPGDLLITRRALERAWPADSPFAPRALVVRTLPNTVEKRGRDYTGQNPPYLSQQAAQLLVSRGIAHLVVDIPSIDRAHDEGRLTAHRVFFGLPRGAVQLAAAGRPAATITELAFVPDAATDGAYLLELQVPALGGDAVPSRPLLYALAASS